MTGKMRGWLGQIILGLMMGIGLGVLLGWQVYPVQYTNTLPGTLRQDYRDDYILMVATAYQVEHDLAGARQRLSFLAPEEPAAPVIELAERLIRSGKDGAEVARLIDLARALGALPTPALAPSGP